MKKLEKYIVDISYSLEQTMKAINANAKGLALVCEGRKLFGIVTDGDIRRYLLSGGSLKETICSAVNKNPCFIQEEKARHRTFLRKRAFPSFKTAYLSYLLSSIIA